MMLPMCYTHDNLIEVAGRVRQHPPAVVTPYGRCNVTDSAHDAFAVKFWSFVDRRGPAECWEWQRCRHRFGHGQASVPSDVPGLGGRVHYAHRIAYHLTHGAVPAGAFVRHTCDNPACCNPAHLVAGTQRENMRDMSRRGRARQTPPRAILTEDDVRDIRRRRASGERCADLAREYGVSYTCISLTSRGLKWAGVEA